MEQQEQSVWTGHPSQIINLPFYLICLVIAGALIAGAIILRDRMDQPIALGMGLTALVPLLIALWRWIETRSHRYELTSERLNLTEGVFSRKTDVLELYRVKDYTIIEPFIYRMFGLGNVVLTTTDDANYKVLLRAVPHVTRLRDQIRAHVEACRIQKGVRITEME